MTDGDLINHPMYVDMWRMSILPTIITGEGLGVTNFESEVGLGMVD